MIAGALATAMGVRLSLLMGRSLPLPPAPDLTAALESATVTVNRGQRTTFSLQFRAHRGRINPTEYALLGRGWGTVTPPTRVVLTVMVGPLPQVLLDGLITSISLTPGQTGEPAQISASGEDLSVLMDLEDRSRERLSPLPVTQVGRTLARYTKHGIIPDLRPGRVGRAYLPIKQVPLQQGTDYQLLRQLADENGCVFTLIPGPVPGMSRAFWGPESWLRAQRSVVPLPALTTNMGAHDNVSGLRFTFDGMAPHRVVGDGPRGRPVVGSPRKAVPLARRSAASIMGSTLRSVRDDSISQTRSSAQARALASARAAQSLDRAVAGSATIDTARYGRIVGAWDVVGVRGAGLSFDGNYQVRSVTHTIQEGRYTQAVSLNREGLGPVIPWVFP